MIPATAQHIFGGLPRFLFDWCEAQPTQLARAVKRVCRSDEVRASPARVMLTARYLVSIGQLRIWPDEGAPETRVRGDLECAARADILREQDAQRELLEWIRENRSRWLRACPDGTARGLASCLIECEQFTREFGEPGLELT